jgi:hypothetical protein
MSSIDEVIARSRQPGEFKEKRRFTVARQQAIQKMRKFALATPYNYILELIQAANANGAAYIDIRVSEKATILSYVGGGFSAEELAQLFDFLFTSKDRLDLAALRQLALGVNALMMAEPSSVVIESGRGTLESTTRVVISAGGTSVEVGTPEFALDGTYIRAAGLNRSKLGNSDPQERNIIEQCCITAPVPLLYNDEAIFGYTTTRIPKISGYKRTVTFDEGDFYGVIGVASTANLAHFRILTFGVWVQSIAHDFGGQQKIGGVISFNKLRKTADHASIVDDDVLKEMWLRLRPYVAKLVGGETGAATFDVHRLGDPTPMMPMDLRKIAKSASTILAFPAHEVSTPGDHALASEFGRVLSAPVLIFGNEDPRSLSVLAAPTPVMFPLLTQDELEFFRQPLALPPPHPWLVDATRLDSVDATLLSPALREFEAFPPVATFLEALVEGLDIAITAYIPSNEPARGQSVCEVRVAERLVWVGVISIVVGAHIVIDLPPITSSVLLAAVEPGGVSVAELVANIAVETRLRDINRLMDSVLSRIPADLVSTNAMSMMLRRASGSVMLALRTGDNGVTNDWVPTPDAPRAMMTLPILRSLGSETALQNHPRITLGQLAQLMDRSGGLIYAAIRGQRAELDGIDTSAVIEVDELEESLMIRMVGEASFVRLDHRDVLAEAAGFQVRDFALGLRTYPDRPLLVEGQGQWSDEVESELVVQLSWLAFRSHRETQVSEDYRRHARRHLAYYAVHVSPEKDVQKIRKRPLFKTIDDRLASMVDLEAFAAAAPSKRIFMADGWATDSASLKSISTLPPWAPGGDLILAPNPFLARLLDRVDLIRTASEPDSFDTSASAMPQYLCTLDVSALRLRGEIGIPLVKQERPHVAFFDLTRKEVFNLDAIAAHYGICGELFWDGEVKQDLRQVERLCLDRAQALIHQLHASVARGDTDNRHRAIEVLLEYASAHIDVNEGTLRSGDALAEMILQLPLFESVHGIPMHARHLITRHLYDANIGLPDRWRATLSDLAGAEGRWLESMCDGRLIKENPSPEVLPKAQKDRESLIEWVRSGIQTLRPDVYGTPTLVGVEGGTDAALVWFRNDLKTLLVNVDHRFFCAALGNDPNRNGHWLMLAIYAFMNDFRHEITNAHELAFQATLAREIIESSKRA